MAKQLYTSWYKEITAGNRDDYLRSLGAGEDVIMYINSVTDPKVAQMLVNEVRKMPGIPLIQLKEFFQANQPQDPYTPFERRIAKNYTAIPGMEQWVLVQFRKHRINNNGTYNYNWPNTFPSVIEGFQEIGDWVRVTGTQIASYDLLQAINLSNQWHEEQAQGGAGEIYQEKNVIYGPEWSNPKWQGWTIQEVRSKNDLAVEGNKMNHCVGSYCENVQKGQSRIFSLRDPQNEPHVTIETDDGEHVQQIRGNSNSDPKEEYKQMVKEWITRGKHGLKYHSENDSSDDMYQEIDTARTRDIADVIRKHMNDTDDYGLQRPTREFDAKTLWDTVYNKIVGRNHDSGYYSWMRNIADAMVDLCASANKLPEFEQMLYEIESENESYMHDYVWEGLKADRISMPDQDAYGSEHEYEAAMEAFQNKENEIETNAREYYLPWALVNDCFVYMNKLNAEKKAVEPVKSASWYGRMR